MVKIGTIRGHHELKSSISFTENSPSAGENQDHIIENAVNVLANDGFLRGQGILTLESVQEFYKMVEQEVKRATLITANLLVICNEIGSQWLSLKWLRISTLIVLHKLHVYVT